MTENILCVKIAQRALNGAYSTFPFERVYLFKKQLEPKMEKVFRYYLTFPLDAPLLSALANLDVQNYEAIPVKRTPRALKGDRPSSIQDTITEPEDWRVIVPTHVRPTKDKKGVPNRARLAYILSKAVYYNRCEVRQLPKVTLVTPTRKIPLLCAVCSRVLEYHTGNCFYGSPTCVLNNTITLPYDDHFSLSTKKGRTGEH